MALRHPFPDYDGEIRPRSELAVSPMMRAPKVVEFRRGADMSAVVAQMKGVQSIFLDAATGAGKSTVFPHEYARIEKSLTFHVVPSRHLAADLFARAEATSSQRNDTPVELLRSVGQQLPRTGVLYMSASMLVLLMLKPGFSMQQHGGITVFLDEAHESDCCTHIVRTLSLAFGAYRLIQASATRLPGDVRPRETPGEVRERMYDSELSPAQWDVADPKAPWHYVRCTENALIFIDSHSQAERLAGEYRRYGFLVHRLESIMTEQQFATAMSELRQPRGPSVILIADSSFRSGFTFDVNLVVDSGQVGYADPAPGQVKRAYRKAYAGELAQAAGRAGRIRSGRVEYWRPTYEPRRVVVDLEGTEREASAYIYRCLGFLPVGILADTLMSKADLPRGVALPSAFNTCYPLTYHIVDSQGNYRDVKHSGEDASENSRDGSARVHADSVLRESASLDEYKSNQRDSGYGSGVTSRRMSQATTVAGDDRKLDGRVVDVSPVDEYVNGWLGAKPSVALVFGEYYKVVGIKPDDTASADFPDGVRSVRRLLSHHDSVASVGAMTKTERRKATALVVTHHTALMVQLDAIGVFIARVAEAGHRDLQHDCRKYMIQIMEDKQRIQTQVRELLSCLDVLTHDQMIVQPIAPFANSTQAQADRMWGDYMRLHERAVRVDDSYLDGMQKALSGFEGKAFSAQRIEAAPRHLAKVKMHDHDRIDERSRDKTSTRVKHYVVPDKYVTTYKRQLCVVRIR